MKAGKAVLAAICIIASLIGWVPGAFASDLPRDGHYIFAHNALPSLLFTRQESVVAAFENRGQAFVERLWAAVMDSVTKKGLEAVDKAGLEFSKEKAGALTVYLVELPKPERMTEAYFVAVAEKEKTTRYFTLELTSGMSKCDASTVLGEWTADGKHINYGCGPKPEKQEFLKAIANKF